MSAAAAPMVWPQRPMREKPNALRKWSMTRLRSSRSWKPKDTYSPSLAPEPAKSKHARPTFRGRSTGTSWKPAIRQEQLSWQNTTHARSPAPAPPCAFPPSSSDMGSKSVQTSRIPRALKSLKSDRSTVCPPMVNLLGYSDASSSSEYCTRGGRTIKFQTAKRHAEDEASPQIAAPGATQSSSSPIAASQEKGERGMRMGQEGGLQKVL
mmetsp:Transcript_12895/g.35705  ORF Transcript_12895/g.35705 Transcript_12895/m.35705 type:complete len:209 (-) Transcript_12895:15-641(-)